MRLIIIGNGFDLAHGLATRFSDFKQYLKSNDEKELIENIDNILNVNGYDAHVDYEWNKIEEIFYKEFLRLKTTENRMVLSYILDDFSKKFHEYMLLETSNKKTKVGKIESFKKYFVDDVAILNFNYTNFYENYINIDKKKILNIHGDLNNEENGNIIIGYFLNYGDQGSHFSDYKKRFPNKEICKTTTTSKYRDKSLLDLVNNFQNTIGKNIDEIVVMGYSFGDSDSHIYELLGNLLKSISKEETLNRSAYEKLEKIKLIIYEYNNDAEIKKNKLLNELKKRDMHFKVMVTGYPREYRPVEKDLIDYVIEKI